MRSAIAFAAAAALSTFGGLETSRAAAACTFDQRQIRAEVQRVTDEVNEQGFDAFRRLPLSEPGAIAMSPLLQWYATRGESIARISDGCSLHRLGVDAFLAAVKTAKGRNFDFGSTPGDPIVQFGDKAAFDVDFAPYRPAITLPYYADHRGITAARYDSTSGKLSLYLFTASPTLQPTIENFRSPLTAATWKKIIAEFKLKRVSGTPYPLSVKGSSFVTSAVGDAREQVSFETSASEMVASASISRNLQTSGSEKTVGTMKPLMLLLFVLVDTNTGAIIEIGANTKERESE